MLFKTLEEFSVLNSLIWGPPGLEPGTNTL